MGARRWEAVLVAVAVLAVSCALLADGTARCWGDNQRSQLGNPSLTQDSTSPVPVERLSGVTALRAGSQATCAIFAGGEPRCWGSNLFGGLGDGGGFSSVPTLVLPV
jgi:alpha-tubulin suppressor-like RCC1 family protein